MYSPQFLVAALVAASSTLAGAISLEPRQSSIACNVARFQIVKALGDTKSAVGDIQDAAVQEAAAAGVKTAQGGILQVAQSLFSGAAPSADGRTAVESGLSATSAALAGGDTADPAIATAQTSLQDAVTAGQDVVANFPRNPDVGGTWLENRYPGCACDIPSHAYHFTWARNPGWASYYSSAEEIWRYFKDVAVRYDLEKYVRLNTAVRSARWDDGGGKWHLEISGADGAESTDSCDILISASGILNSWKYPDIPGLDVFGGRLMHSAQWDESFVFDDNVRVAVIGGGSSAVQIVPSLQHKVQKLIAFLRSPVWVTTGFGAKHAAPGGTNFDYSEEQKAAFRGDADLHNKYCRDVEGELNKRFNLMHLHSDDQKNSRKLIADIMAQKIDDEALTRRMVPDFALGCRRMTPGSGYLESLTKGNVDVVHESVVRLTGNGVVDAAGVEHEVDVVVCATGFDTSFAPHFKVTGRRDADIAEQFGDFPKGYLGMTVENFPNLFLLMGPNSPTSHGSILPIMEWATRYIFQVISKMQTEDIKAIEPKSRAIKEYYNHTHELMKRLAWSSPCRSWFKNGKVHGPVTAIYPGSRLHWFEMLKNVRWEDYDIDYRSDNRFSFMGNGFSQAECDPEGDPVWYFDDPFTRI